MLKIYIAEAAHSEKGSGHYGYDGSASGDQLQKHQDYSEKYPLDDYREDEVRMNTWYDKPWRHIYRAKDEAIRNEFAIRMEQCLRNPYIGYSQPGRLGLYNALMRDPDPSHIKTYMECDCSSMVNACMYVTMKTHGINPIITGREVTAEMSAKYDRMCKLGFFNDVISDVNLETGEGVMRGDLLLGDPATHTAAVIAVVPTTSSRNIEPLWTGQVYNCDQLNVRTGPGATYPVYDKWPVLSRGNLISVCDEENGWYYIRISGTGYLHYAWVSKKYITGNVQANAAKEGKVTAVCLCLRKTPIDGNVLKYMPYNSRVVIHDMVTARNGKPWYEATYNGAKGYCSAQYIKEV